jgi:uncharacterized damage-inducible protein DinB
MRQIFWQIFEAIFNFRRSMNMKQLFLDYAKYNETVNSKLCEIITSNPKTLKVKTNGYYQTFQEILNHIYFSNDLYFIQIYKEVLPQIAKDKINDKYDLDEIKYNNMVNLFNSDFKQFLKYRKELDAHIIEFIIKLTDEIIIDHKVISYDENGNQIEEFLWKSLLKAFNHQTHHRGQITAFLDQMKIENDISFVSWS